MSTQETNDFTTAEPILHRIVNLDDFFGDAAAEAPGIDARHALEIFNRDACDGEGLLFFREDLGDAVEGGRAWVLNLGERGEYVAYPSDDAETLRLEQLVGAFVPGTRRVTVALWDTDLDAVATALAGFAEIDGGEHVDVDNLRRLSALFRVAGEETPRREADVVREAHFDDATVSHADYGQMVEEADERDRDREARAELSDEADERVVDLDGERQYREEFRTGRDPRD